MHACDCDGAAQEMVYYQTIDDDDEDLLAAILSASDAAPKYNPELLKGTLQQQACPIFTVPTHCLSTLLRSKPEWPHRHSHSTSDTSAQCGYPPLRTKFSM